MLVASERRFSTVLLWNLVCSLHGLQGGRPIPERNRKANRKPCGNRTPNRTPCGSAKRNGKRKTVRSLSSSCVGGEWRNVDSFPDGEAKRAAWEVFKRLDRLSAEAIGAAPSAKVSPSDTATASRWWLIHYPDRDPVEVAYCPEATHADILERHPDAVAAEPFTPTIRQPSAPLTASEETAIRAWLALIKKCAQDCAHVPGWNPNNQATARLCACSLASA